MSAWGELSATEVYTSPPMNKIIDRCKNITFPQLCGRNDDVASLNYHSNTFRMTIAIRRHGKHSQPQHGVDN